MGMHAVLQTRPDAGDRQGELTMPIRKDLRKFYTGGWKTVVRPAILERAGNCCERCGKPNNTTVIWPNYNYLQYKIHADAAFVVIGPESLLPQFQLG